MVDSRESTSRTVIPSRALASSGVAKLLLSASIMGASIPASRVIETVMRTLVTLATSTVMTTALELTPAALAMELCKPEVSA